MVAKLTGSKPPDGASGDEFQVQVKKTVKVAAPVEL
jgi:hypothetical protein